MRAWRELGQAVAYAGHELAEATHFPALVRWLAKVIGQACPCGECNR